MTTVTIGDRTLHIRNQLYIDGQWVETAKKLPVYNPSTGKVILEISSAGPEEVNAAVAAAKRAFESENWGISTTGAQRAVFLRKMAALMTERKALLSGLDSIDMGKPLLEAEDDVVFSVMAFEYFASLAEKLDTEQGVAQEISDPNFSGYSLYEPIGVAGAITPWNYPLMMAAQKVGAALGAGCSVVLKPSELAPLSSLELAAIAHEVGLPHGVLNVIPGLGVDAGSPLSLHPDVGVCSFTGSVPTGKNIMKAGAETIKKIYLELGGKSAMIVLEDADQAVTLDWLLLGIFCNAGQVCSATSRVLIHESIYAEFLPKIIEAAKAIRTGAPDETTPTERRVGPIVSKVQYDKVMGFLSRAREAGVQFAAGGEAVAGEGWFIQPTVLVDVPTTAEVWCEEIFGPVLCVRSFKTEEEAISLANASKYGLAAAVMGNTTRAHAIARRLQAGTVWINNSQPVFTTTPFGGYKQSGFGREMGAHSLHEFLQTKQVTSALNGFKFGVFVS